MTRARPTASGERIQPALHAVLLFAVVALVQPVVASAERASCPSNTDAQRTADALKRIERSVDPCGESDQVIDVLKKFAHCSKTNYRICLNNAVDRNVFDRPTGPHGEPLARTITWNPGLRSTLEPGCDGDPTRPVQRDPLASLLHEIAHAVQDCTGLNPGEHELEAVRIENIYRRAAGLCQRTGYGENPLPQSMVRRCTPGNCSCFMPSDDRAHQAAVEREIVPEARSSE